MFDLSLTEIALIVLAALLVIKPEDLPTVMRHVKKALRTVGDIGREFTHAMNDIADKTGVNELREELKGLPRVTDLEGNQQPTYKLDDVKDGLQRPEVVDSMEVEMEYAKTQGTAPVLMDEDHVITKEVKKRVAKKAEARKTTAAKKPAKKKKADA